MLRFTALCLRGEDVDARHDIVDVYATLRALRHADAEWFCAMLLLL